MKIDLSHIKNGLELEIQGEENTLFEISDEEVLQHGEAKYQLLEGCSYEYQFTEDTFNFKENSKKNTIITFSKFGKHKGGIIPNIYVGTHSLEIENTTFFLFIEVRSVKS
jgi:hypothetical protein